MIVFYDGVCIGVDLGAGGALAVGRHGGFHIEQMLGVGHTDAHLALCYKLLGSCYRFRGEFLEDLQLEGRFAAHSAQRRSYRESDHAGAGDAYAHAVLEYVAADGDIQVEIGLEPPLFTAATGTVVLDDFDGLGHCQGHRYGFGAPERGLHLTVDYFEYLFI